MDRRQLLKGALVLATAAAEPLRAARPGPATLRDRAARKGLTFGSAVASYQLTGARDYAAILAREAGMLVAEYEMKRDAVQPEANRYDFSGADRIVAFAAANQMAVRGHTLCWYAANPPWLEADLTGPGLTTDRKRMYLREHVRTMLTRYRGRIPEWDVVNEPVDPTQGRPDGMRAKNVWSQALGEQYIDLAFHEARAADPHARLFLNEYGIEAATVPNERKRTAILKLLDRLKGRGVPVDGFGIQAHMRPYKDAFDDEVFARFLDQLRGYGLRISITEMDFSDRGGALDPARRDADMATAARRFLDVALACPATRTVMAWGMCDRYSWLSSPKASDGWPGGQLARVLPLDGALRRKPLYDAIGAAFDAAAPRRTA